MTYIDYIVLALVIILMVYGIAKDLEYRLNSRLEVLEGLLKEQKKQNNEKFNNVQMSVNASLLLQNETKADVKTLKRIVNNEF